MNSAGCRILSRWCHTHFFFPIMRAYLQAPMKGNMKGEIQALLWGWNTSCSNLWCSRFCNNLNQGRVHQWIIQYQKVSPENIHKSNIVKTEQVAFMYLTIYMYIYIWICIFIYTCSNVTTVHEEKGHKFEREQNGT